MFMPFFKYFTVDTRIGLQPQTTQLDREFLESQFRVSLVDSFGCLWSLLRYLETICLNGGESGSVALAVDFEGLKLSRNGALCLVQLICSDDPTLVYVIDVCVLGARAFSLMTAQGTSLKVLLENRNIRKVWFDPRNDVDALYHQFGIMAKGIFDLQLAEVAERRSRGLNVSFVQSLGRCLSQCPSLNEEQKAFAEHINTLGKNLFEPQCGGSYQIFHNRPLAPAILVYASHDARYMLLLHEQYVAAIGHDWVQRVLAAGDVRGRWCLNPDYVTPSSDAPDF